MSEEGKLPGDESPDEVPSVTDTRTYSDLIMYFSKNGRFQVNSLYDQDRRKGVLSLMKAERIHKLTLDRRLSPVKLTLTAGQPSQDVYLFALVRKAVSHDELTDLVRRLNAYIDGMTLAQKEEAVAELIFATKSRVQPGIRFLPDKLYEEDQIPPDAMYDDEGRPVDEEGLPLLDTDDEVKAFQRGASRRPSSKDVYMPSVKTNLPDASTDSEGPFATKKEKRSRSPTPWPGSDDDEDEGSPSKRSHLDDPDADKDQGQGEPMETNVKPEVPEQDEPMSQGGEVPEPERQPEPHHGTETVIDPDVETEPDPERENEQDPEQQREQAPVTIDFDPSNFSLGARSSMASMGLGAEASRSQADTISELKDTVAKLADGVKSLAEQVEILQQFNKGPLAEILSRQQAGQEGPAPVQRPLGQTASRGNTPPYHNDTESEIASYFPINQYTQAMNWFLKRPIVQTFLYYEVIRIAYRTHPLFKPDADFVLGVYMDYLCSTRLQTHFGKSTGSGSTLDFARFPMPQVIVDIANTKLVDIGKRRVPGGKDNAELIKVRGNNMRRNHLLGSDYIRGSASVEQMAHRILTERHDFYEMHVWLFPSRSAKDLKWDFKKELSKTKKLSLGKTLPRDANYDASTAPMDDDIEHMIFPSLDKGQPMYDMAVAERLEKELIDSKVTKPVLPKAVWDLVRSVVEPTPEDIRIAKQQALQVQQKHDAKNARRRARRQAAKGHVTDFESDEDDEEEEQSTPPISTHAGQAEKPTAGPSSGQRSLGPEETGARPKERRPTNPGNERADMVQELFGSVSDISSSNTGSDKTPTMAIMRTLEDGTIQFVQGGPTGFGAQDVQEPGQGTFPAVPSSSASRTGVLASAEILKEAEQRGLASDQANVVVATEITTTASGQYSVIVTETQPAPQQPTVVQGSHSAKVTSTETLTRAPRDSPTPAPVTQQPSMSELYSDMSVDPLDEGVLEGKFSSDSSSSDGKQSKAAKQTGTRVQSQQRGKSKEKDTSKGKKNTSLVETIMSDMDKPMPKPSDTAAMPPPTQIAKRQTRNATAPELIDPKPGTSGVSNKKNSLSQGNLLLKKRMEEHKRRRSK